MSLLIGLIAFILWLGYIGRELAKRRDENEEMYHNGATVWVLPHLRAFYLQITDNLTAGTKTY